MGDRKRFTNEGIGRIWKTTLAKTVDLSSAQSRNRKDVSQRPANREYPRPKTVIDNDNDTDELDAVNIQAALQNIRSLPGSGSNVDGDGGGSLLTTAHSERESERKVDVQQKIQENKTPVENFVVKINNDIPVRKKDQSHERRFPNKLREVKEQQSHGSQFKDNGQFCKRSLSLHQREKEANHSTLGVKGGFGPGSNKGVSGRRDGLNQKQWEEKSELDLPPRHRHKRNEEVIKEEQQPWDDEKKDDKPRVAKVGEEAKRVDNGPKMDAYDKWKMKRQIPSLLSLNPVIRPQSKCGRSSAVAAGQDETQSKNGSLHVSSSDKDKSPTNPPDSTTKTPSNKSSRVIGNKDSSDEEILYAGHSEPTWTDSHKTSTTTASNRDSEEVVTGVDNSPSYFPPQDDYDPAEYNASDYDQEESQTTAFQDDGSAMDKIQTLFQAYISPMTPPRMDADQNKSKRMLPRISDTDQERMAGGDKSLGRRHLNPTPAVTNDDTARPDEKAMNNCDGENSNNNSSVKNKSFGSAQEYCVEEESDDEDDEVLYRNMKDLHVREQQQLEDSSKTDGIENHEIDDKEDVYLEDPVMNKLKYSYPPNAKSLMKSPASIPSGFSSDYDVGIVSQSQSEAEDEGESPHPHPHPAANLFPSQFSQQHGNHHHHPEDEERDLSKRNPNPASMFGWSGYYGHQQQPAPIPPHLQIPAHHPHPHPPVWYHPHYNHPDPYYRPPYPHPHPHMSPAQSPYHQSPSAFHHNQQQPSPPLPLSQSQSSEKNVLIVPSERFADKDCIDKVKDFVAAKTEDWNKFMTHRTGQAVPVDVVIKVTLSGAVTENDDANARGGMTPNPNSYPLGPGGWSGYPPTTNMPYRYSPYYPHPHQPYTDPSGVYPQPPTMTHEPSQHLMEEEDERKRESLEDKLATKNHHNNHPSSNQFTSTPNSNPGHSYSSQHFTHTTTEFPDDHTDSVDPEDMKRRCLFNDDDGGGAGDGKIAQKKVKSQISDDIKSQNNAQEDKDNLENQKSVPDRKLKSVNSVSSFLNPNDLKNDWKTTKSVAKHSKYDVGSSSSHQPKPPLKEQERDRSPHSTTTTSKIKNRCYRSSNQANASFSDEDEVEDGEIPDSKSSPPAAVEAAVSSTPDTTHPTSKSKTSFDQKSVCVVERRNSLKFERSLSDDKDYAPITKNWHEVCPEPEPKPNHSQQTVREQHSPTDQLTALSPQSSNSSFLEYGSVQNRRRSDSVVSYSSDDHYPWPKDYRLCQTPGASSQSQQNTRRFPESTSGWKNQMMTRSRSYRHKFIDTHCHIDFLYHRTFSPTIPFKQYMEENADSFPVNFEGCVAVFCNPKVFSETTQAYAILKQLAYEETSKVWIAIGCHPKSAGEFKSHHINRLRQFLLEHPKTVALGEIGLDYSKSFHLHAAIQKEVFIKQLILAKELDLPLVIHCRDADTDCLEIMKKLIPAKHKIHLHCFTRHISICRRWMEHFPNLFVGFTPLIAYPSAREATQAASMVPLDRLLLETDAPYFVPTGSGGVKGVSHPGLALFTAERLAQLKNVSVDTVLEACRKNTHAMYGI